MPIYTYESKDGKRIERFYTVADSPQTIRSGGRRYGRVITMPARPVIENVAGIHHGPGTPTIIRNMHDVREAEARKPGLKFNPEYFHDRKRR